MKKSALFFSIIVASFSYSFAQETSVGFRIGVNSSTFKVDDRDTDGLLKRTSSPAFAIPIDIKISDKYSFQPEISFVKRGFRLVIDEKKSLDYYASIKYNVNYFEIPLLGKANFDFDKIRISAFAGPSIGLALGGKISYYENDEGDISRDSEKIDLVDNDIKRIELCLNIGGMASYEIGKGRAFVDLRFQTGITKAFEDARSNMIGFSFGYLVPLNSDIKSIFGK
jgi:hypothetical protein